MTTAIRTWADSDFYLSGAGTANVREQILKTQSIGKLVRALSDASTVDTNGDKLQDVLQGFSFGTLTQRHKMRVLYDSLNNRLLVQENTGTDAAKVFAERFRIDVASGNVTATGSLSATSVTVRETAGLVLGGDLDVNDFYIRSAADIQTQTIRVTGQATFSNNHTLGLVYITAKTASSSPVIDFSGLSDYPKYIVELEGVRPSVDGSLFMQVSTNNGASFLASGYATSGMLNSNFGPTSTAIGSSGGSAWNIMSDGSTLQGTAAASAIDGTVKIHNRGSATLQARGRSQLDWFEANDIFSISSDIGLFVSPGASITAIRFFYLGSGASAAQIASGTFRLYGVRSS